MVSKLKSKDYILDVEIQNSHISRYRPAPFVNDVNIFEFYGCQIKNVSAG